MSKQEGAASQKPAEVTTTERPATASKAGGTHGTPAHGMTSASSKIPPKSNVGVGTKAGCHAFHCNEKDVRYHFCEEHFQQFKFGLITKIGEPVQDYDRKLEHYQRWQANKKAA